MTQALIDNLPLIAAAPNGIKSLRSLILDLAVRGKLTPQDPQDEPAGELLKRIAAEKARLVKIGHMKADKVLPKISDAERLFESPRNWEWARLGAVIDLVSGQHLKPEEYSDFPQEGAIPYLTGPAEFGERHPDPTRYTLERRALAIAGDILVTVKGSGVGKINEVCHGELAISRQLMAVRPIVVDASFTSLLLRTLSAQFQEKTVGIAIPGISREDVRESQICIPPLAEQRRIVAKVDELMALCYRLEAQQADAEAVHATLVKTLLDTLTQSQDADDFAANWHRLSQHFPTIFTTEASVDALKQMVVELAVTGKLVSQNPEDQPAAAFLGRIRSARTQLIARKIIKADKSLPVLTTDAFPFAPPSGWEWVRLDEVVLISGGLTLGRTFVGRELVSLPYLRVANVQRGHLALSEIKQVLVPPEEVEKYRLLPQDLLITEGGDWDKVGRTAIWRGEIDNCLHQNHVFKARPLVSDFNDRWAELYLNSAVARSYFAGASKQTTNLASINMTQLKACLLPIPPLAEQHRIVAKVDDLLALCDTLKAQIAESRKVQRQLAIALVEQTLAA